MYWIKSSNTMYAYIYCTRMEFPPNIHTIYNIQYIYSALSLPVILQDTINRSDHDLAAETLREHLQRHDSVVYKTFSAQYHSTLKCPQCHTKSCTFDPYLCVSLSVPRRGTRPLYITMARRYQKQTRLQVFGLSVKVQYTHFICACTCVYSAV